MKAVAATAIAVFLALPSVAAAKSHDPGDSSSVAQYMEQIPTSTGKATAKTGGTSSSLPPKVASSIRANGGSDAGVLRSIATSPAYGAPPRSHGAVAKHHALAEAPSGGDGTSAFMWVLAGLVAVTAVVGLGARGARRTNAGVVG